MKKTMTKPLMTAGAMASLANDISTSSQPNARSTVPQAEALAANRRSVSRLHVLACASALLMTASLCAADDSMALIQGRFAGNAAPDEIALNQVENGETVLHSKVKVARDGAFGFYFKPERPGFYTVGGRGDAARLYIAPGKRIQITLEDGLYSVGADDRENTLLAAWAKALWDLKKCNQMRGSYTYKDVFPILPALEKARDNTAASAKSGNPDFDRLFPSLVMAEFEYELYHFLYMPRSMHPEQNDYPAIYKQVSSGPHFTSDTVLQFDFGMNFVASYLMFQYQQNKADVANQTDVMAEMCLKYVGDDTVKGWYIAKQALTRARAYDEAYAAKLEKFRKYLVTDAQRKLVSDFVLTINKTGTGQPAMPFEGTTPDGRKVKLSDFKGKVVVVDVWATWCGPCRQQTPHLKKLEEEMHGRDVVFIGYSVDDLKDLEKWKKMVVDDKLGGVQVIGNAAFKSPICLDYKITAIPRFMVFDQKGNIVSIDAPRPSTPELKALLEKHLKPKT